jgi:xanthine dehydrogenase accessory factor
MSFLEEPATKILVEVTSVKGSTPRDAGTFMLVSATTTAGTIGGGQLEYMAIDHARAFLAGKTADAVMDVPLGPEIGQCCGGRVNITFTSLTAEIREQLNRKLTAEKNRQPKVYVFGAGHVGHALAKALTLLPLNTTMVETRRDELNGLPKGVEAKLNPMPESLVADIPANSAIVILTHDHALDFLIAAEALKRDDLAYIGMIGSATKKATFANWLRRQTPDADISRLTLPIGGPLKDKRPEIIAALTAAELVLALQNSSHAVAEKATDSRVKK